MKRGMRPPQPGPAILDLLIEDRGLSITAAAKLMDVSRKQLSEVVNGVASLTPEMAIRIERVFGSSADLWMKMQADYDLWLADNSGKLDHLKPIADRKPQKRAS